MLAMQRQELQKIAEGREAEMFAWEEGTILRLLRDPEAGRLNERQAAAIESARSLGVPVPAVYGSETVMGRPGLIMEGIEGTDLLTLIGRRPWMAMRTVDGQVRDLTVISPVRHDDDEQADRLAIQLGREKEVGARKGVAELLFGVLIGYRRSRLAVVPAEGERVLRRLSGALQGEHAIRGVREVKSR